MTKSIFSFLIVVTLILTSCKQELVPQDSAENPISTPIDSTISEATPEVVNAQPEQSVESSNQVVTQTPAKVLPGMNPPHGQAGHDCGIAVGAPLNSKKATPKVATPTTITTTQANETTATPATPAILNPNAATTTTAPGMNPPHGQAGHQCGIAVGAPLPKS